MVLMRLQLSRRLLVLISHWVVMCVSDKTVVGSPHVILMIIALGRNV